MSAIFCRPPQELWISVVIQACRDAMIPSSVRTGDRALARDAAIEWFEEKRYRDDFETVCRNAGLDPIRVSRAYWDGTLDTFFGQGRVCLPADRSGPRTQRSM